MIKMFYSITIFWEERNVRELPSSQIGNISYALAVNYDFLRTKYCLQQTPSWLPYTSQLAMY